MSTNHKAQVEGVAGSMLALTWGTTILRFYVRAFMVRSFWLEDWLALAALLLFTITAAFSLLGISHSMGQHLAQVPLDDLAPAMMYWFSVELAYVLTTCVLKLSIAVFLLRIATRKAHRAILYTLITTVILLTIAYFFFLVFQCSPINFFWLQFSGEVGSCLPAKVVGNMTYAHSAINASCDVILALLPIVIVSQLDINIRTKISLCAIMSLGIVACAAVITRIPYIKILVKNADDFLYSSTDVVIWSAIEPALGITAANLATLRPLFATFFSRNRLFGYTTTPNINSGYGNSRGVSGYSVKRGYMRSTSQGGQEESILQNEVPLNEFGKLETTKENATITATGLSPSSRRVSSFGREEVGLAISSNDEMLHGGAATSYYEAQEEPTMRDVSTTPWARGSRRIVRTEMAGDSNIVDGEQKRVRRTGSLEVVNEAYPETFLEKDSFEEEMERRGRSNTGASERRRPKGLSPPHFYSR